LTSASPEARESPFHGIEIMESAVRRFRDAQVELGTTNVTDIDRVPWTQSGAAGPADTPTHRWHGRTDGAQRLGKGNDVTGWAQAATESDSRRAE
jgi:hypothetical protein